MLQVCLNNKTSKHREMMNRHFILGSWKAMKGSNLCWHNVMSQSYILEMLHVRGRAVG